MTIHDERTWVEIQSLAVTTHDDSRRTNVGRNPIVSGDNAGRFTKNKVGRGLIVSDNA